MLAAHSHRVFCTEYSPLPRQPPSPSALLLTFTRKLVRRFKQCQKLSFKAWSSSMKEEKKKKRERERDREENVISLGKKDSLVVLVILSLPNSTRIRKSTKRGFVKGVIKGGVMCLGSYLEELRTNYLLAIRLEGTISKHQGGSLNIILLLGYLLWIIRCFLNCYEQDFFFFNWSYWHIDL